MNNINYFMGKRKTDERREELDRKWQRDKEELERKKREEERREQERQARMESVSNISKESEGINTNRKTKEKMKPLGLDEVKAKKNRFLEPYANFSYGLSSDIAGRVEQQRALGLNDEDIKKSLVPKEDNLTMKRLEDISSKLKSGDESFLYNIKEGWHEKEVQNIISKEQAKKMNGLPNKLQEVEDWLSDNPELYEQRKEDNWIADKLLGGSRGFAGLVRQQVDSSISAAKDPASWAWAGAITAASVMAAPFTGGTSLAGLTAAPLAFAKANTATTAIASLKPLAALNMGMSAGRYNHMAEMEMASSYAELEQSGVDDRVAIPLATSIGAVNGVIEFMQLDTAFSMIPGVEGLTNKASDLAKKEFVKKAGKLLAGYGKNFSTEVLEEVAQAGVSDIGLELGKYLQDVPEPRTLEGLSVMAKHMTTKDFRDTLIDEGYGAARAMWLSPIISSAGRVTINKAMEGMVDSSNQSKINEIINKEDNMSKKERDNLIEYFTAEDEGNIDRVIQIVNETLDPASITYLSSQKEILSDFLTRDDITNQERVKLQNSLEKIDKVVSKVMYEAKEQNPDMEYKPTNDVDIESDLLSNGYLDNNEIFNENLNKYTLELYNKAKSNNVLDVIKEDLIKGKSKSEVMEKIKKSLPRKERKPLDMFSMINAVELVQNEIKAQRVMNKLYNLQEMQANVTPKANLDVESETTQTVKENEATQGDLRRDEEVTNATVLNDREDSDIEQSESLDAIEAQVTEDNTEVVENIEKDTELDEVVDKITEETTKPIADEEFLSSDVKKVQIDKINVDPDRFQFRYERGNAGGATKKLAGAEYNPMLAGTVLLWQDEYGDLYVVNGHHRVDLAKNSDVSEIDAKVISHKEYSAEEARALGAMINIAEDNASSIDVAKLIRDEGTTEVEFKNIGISPNSKIARDGRALSNLNEWIFTQVATKAIAPERAIIIGRELAGNADGQNQIIKAIDTIESRGKSITNDILTELIAEVKGTAQEQFEEITLFGAETMTKNYSIERAEVVSYVKGQLKDRISLLRNVSKNKNAAILKELGNEIAIDDNVREMNAADQALWILDKTLNYQGTKANELFNRYAMEYAKSDPMNRTKIKKKALDELVSLIESGKLLSETVSQETSETNQTRMAIDEVAQTGILGQATMLQMKETPSANIVVSEDAKKSTAYKATRKIVEAIKNNPVFNGLEVRYTNETGKRVFTREELDANGYGHYQEGEKTVYGTYNDGDRSITLNREATRDTILEEAIHDIQYRLQEIDPELNELVTEWEDEVRANALKEGIVIPDGYELLAQSLVYTEFGYASTNPFIANLIAVDDEIVDKFKVLLGDDLTRVGMGFVESGVAKADRKLGAKRLDSNAKNVTEINPGITYQIKPMSEKIDSKEFKDWFGDSKVVDKDGKPLIVYHGSPNIFEEFRPSNAPGWGEGIYFTDNIDNANEYSYSKSGEKLDPYKVYISMENPYTEKSRLSYEDIETTKVYKNLVAGMTEDELYSIDAMEKFYEDGNFANAVIRDLGYDGIMYDGANNIDGYEIVVFNPTQIKSIYNNGMFNEYDPNINYQLKESINNVDHYELEYGSSIYNNFIKDGIETNLVYKTEEQNGLSTLLVDMVVEDKEIHDMVIRDTVLGGYDYLKMGDNEPTLITNQMIEEAMTQGQPIFQLKEESNGSLLAMHNIDKNKLKNAIKLGGFPMPSIAVAKKDLQYTNFGNITLLFDKDTIDPQASKLNKVYSGDAYTPVFPTVYNKINKDVAKKLNNMVYDRVPSELRDRFASPLDEDNIGDKLDRWGSFKDAYSNDVGLMIAYLNEKGIPFETATTNKKYGGWDYELLDKLADKFPALYDEKYIDMNVANEIAPELTDIINEHERETFKEDFPDFTLFKETMEFGQIDRLARNVYEYVADKNRTVIDRNETEQNIKNAINEDDFSNWLEEISEGIIEKTGFRNNKDMFTPSGNRRKWETLHEEVTLDNVVRAMKKEPDQAATGHSGIGQFMAVNSQEFKSLQHIRDSIDMLVDLDNEEFKELKDDYSNRLLDIANKIKNPRASDGFTALISATDILIEAIRDNKTKPSIMKALQSYASDGYITLSNFSENELFDLVDDVKEMPTQYFEAKPRRAVRFNEVQAALIDESRLSGEEELTEIKDMLKSVGVNVVETYSEDNRQQAMDNLLGKQDVTFQIKDTTTPEFKNWFRESKAVDSEGKPIKMYHGTPNRGFNKFNRFPAYFSPMKSVADIYQSASASMLRPGAEQKDSGTYEVYLRMERPFDTRDPEVKQLFYDEYYRKYGTGTDLMNSGLPDWTDGEDIYEFIQEKGYSYDGIILDEGALGGYGDDVTSRGESYLVFEPTQIKSVDNRGSWDATNPNIYYQLKDMADMEERSWGQTIRDSDITSQELKDLLTSSKFMYEVKSNVENVFEAAKYIDKKGEEFVEAWILSDIPGSDKMFAASQILTAKYMESGDRDRAMAIIDKTGSKATSLGQAIQILSVWGRQTPTGMLKYTAKKFGNLMTDADKKNIQDKTKLLKEEFNRINREALEGIDFVDSIDKIKKMDQEEMVTREIAKTEKGQNLVGKYGLKGIFQALEGDMTQIDPVDMDDISSFKADKTVIDDDMTSKILDTMNEHYRAGKGNLEAKLKELGLNDPEVKALVAYGKEQLKQATEASKKDFIDKTLPKSKQERESLADKFIEASLDNSMDDNKLKSLIAEKLGLPVLDDELVDYIYEQGQYINSLEEGSRERDVATAEMMAEIANRLPTSMWEKVGVIQTMAHLLNIRTTLRNLIGNELFGKVDTITQNYLGSGLDALIGLKSGERTTIHRNIFKLFTTQYKGYGEGLRLGVEDAIKGISTIDTQSKYELRKQKTFNSGVLGGLETVLNVTMRATDRAAQTAAYFDSIQEQMTLAGVDTPTEQMIDNATALGLYRTFNDDTALSQAFGKGKKALNDFSSYFTGQRDFGLGDLILKYPSTPANILARAMDYSPIGVITTMLDLYKDTSGDNYLKQKMAVQGISRAISGTSLIAIGALLAKLGVLTGGDPEEDEKIYEMKKQAGLRDYGVNVGAMKRLFASAFKDPTAGELRQGDTIVAYDWIEPMAIPLAIGADTAEGGDAMSTLDAIIRASTKGMQALTEQPLLTGLTRLFGYGDPVSGAAGAIMDIPASFTPSLLGHVSNLIDGEAKDFYTNYSKGRRAYNAVLNKLPVAKAQLPNKYSTLGEKMRYYPEDIGMVSRVLTSMVSPAFYGDYEPSKEAKLLFDLYDSTGSTDHIPKAPQKTYTIDKVKYSLTPKEYEEMSRWLGKEVTSRIKYAENNYMSNWPDQDKVDEISYIIKELGKEAREKVKKEYMNIVE